MERVPGRLWERVLEGLGGKSPGSYEKVGQELGKKGAGKLRKRGCWEAWPREVGLRGGLEEVQRSRGGSRSEGKLGFRGR